MRALTICQPTQSTLTNFYPTCDPAFGNWLAGFADGEGCFYLTATNGSHRCQFRIKLRIDDKAILDEIQFRTGLGYVKTLKGGVNPQAEWMVVRKADCVALCRIFDQFQLRAKKSRDYAIWREAVMLLAEVRHVVQGGSLRNGQGSTRHPNQLRLAELRQALSKTRKIA